MTNNPQTRHGRSILTAEQQQQLIENIRKAQLASGPGGGTKKDVTEKAFTETFGGTDWPIHPNSSTIQRYWLKAFPPEKQQAVKRQKKSSLQPLLDDLRRPAPTPAPIAGYKKIVCICPECNTLIKIETTKL